MVSARLDIVGCGNEWLSYHCPGEWVSNFAISTSVALASARPCLARAAKPSIRAFLTNKCSNSG
eukprot:9329403-Alexandrium_andersonii.AAC.1